MVLGMVHNGASCHKSNVIQNLSNRTNVIKLKCPGNSLNLNPIENLLEIIKNRVVVKVLSSSEALTEAVKEVLTKETRLTTVT